MTRFLLSVLVSVLAGCGIVKPDDSGNGDSFQDTETIDDIETAETGADTSDSNSDSAVDTANEDSDSSVDSSTDSLMDTADTEIDDSGEDSAVDDGCTFEVQGTDGVWYVVNSYLVFSLDIDSAVGILEPGFDDIITVNVSAACGDAVLEHIYIDFSGTDIEGIDWIGDINNVVSGVCYDWDDMGHFDGFGLCSSRPVDLYDDGSEMTAVWDLTFPLPILIPEDETFSFSLQIRMGGTEGLQPSFSDLFRASVERGVSWYGIDDPDSYPESSILDPVFGNTLMLGE
ncbi:MAG: hypothetical protein WCT28_03245 [Patescibacteria group bacterium]|jgi:hypothetical protein